MRRLLVLCVLLAAAAPGCVRYGARPLLPQETALRFRDRVLDADGLRRHLETALGAKVPGWPLESWTLETLTHAAFYFHPALDAARARWSVARAQVLTASGRPPAAAEVTPAYTAGADRSPWFSQFGFNLTLETAGKREYRTGEAVQRAEAERAGVALAAWSVYAGVRDAVLAFQTSSTEWASLGDEEDVRAEYVSLLDSLVTLGELARPILDAARLDLQRTQIAAARAEAAVEDARGEIARRIGVPASTITTVRIEAAPADAPRIEPSRMAEIVGAALLDRIELRQMLAEYAAVDAAVRLAVAQQVPDIGLAPVIRWAVDQQRWALGAGLNPLSRQRGPIAEAMARRDEAASRFYARQAEVAGDAEAALGRYQSAMAEYDRATQLLAGVEARAADIQMLFDLRDIDAVALAGARLEVVLARRARTEALSRAHRTLGTLEDAIHRPLTLPGGFPANLELPPMRDP